MLTCRVCSVFHRTKARCVMFCVLRQCDTLRARLAPHAWALHGRDLGAAMGPSPDALSGTVSAPSHGKPPAEPPPFRPATT
eukprot:2930897-Rhodomonas_salina.2